MQPRLFSDLIEQHVPLGRQASTGYRATRCAVCNDHSPRAGWKFDEGAVIHSCFNCGVEAKVVIEEGTGKISRKARRVLEAYGVPPREIDAVLSSVFFSEAEPEISVKQLSTISLATPEIALPDRSFPIGHAEHLDEQLPLAEYLEGRCLDPLQLRAHFSLDPRFKDRVIIPFYRAGRIIYWQARTIHNVKPRYVSASVSKSAVFYNYDELLRGDNRPLFVTEGPLDAAPVRGVALIGSTISAAQLEVLRKTRRRLIFVIDRDQNGEGVGEVAAREGWEVTFVDKRAKDINDSLQRFGPIYTTYSLLTSASSPAPRQLSRMNMDMELVQGRLRAR